MTATLITTIISSLAIIIVALIAYKKEIKIRKLEASHEQTHIETTKTRLKGLIIGKLLDLASISLLQKSVDNMFKETKADRFLLLFALNGKTDFNVVSVVFEQHQSKKYKVNAIVKYRDVKIDSSYRNMLKELEVQNVINVDVSKMEPQLLKDLYTMEKVKHAQYWFLDRQHLDEENDVIVYSSIATHESEPFTQIEKTKISLEYNSTIIRVIKKFL